MREFFSEGGFPMVPIAILGLASLALAAWYAVKPNARMLPLVRATASAALLAGVLGTVLGVKETLRAITGTPALVGENMSRIAMAGLAESSNNLVLALVLVVMAVLAVGVGGYRSKEPALA